MSHIFSLKGKALKLDTRDDMEKHLKGVDASAITEIHLEGNTIGVDASEALAEWMAGAKNLKVSFRYQSSFALAFNTSNRSPTSQTSIQVV